MHKKNMSENMQIKKLKRPLHEPSELEILMLIPAGVLSALKKLQEMQITGSWIMHLILAGGIYMSQDLITMGNLFFITKLRIMLEERIGGRKVHENYHHPMI